MPLLDEVYAALDNNLKVLATIGIRTIIDRMMTHEVGDLGDFGKKLGAFEAKGI
jgi:hypothetical protein